MSVIAQNESAIVAEPEPKSGIEGDVRSRVRQWLVTTGDRGVSHLYDAIRRFLQTGEAERLRDCIYLYWLAAQVSGQDSEIRWKDLRKFSEAQDIHLNHSIDVEVIKMLEEIESKGGNARKGSAERDRARLRDRVRVSQLHLLSDIVQIRSEPSREKAESAAWEKVDFPSLRRADRLVFG